MKTYKIGDSFWTAVYGNKLITKPCSICFGKVKVTLILGNDDEMTLPCENCAKGYDGPRGFVEEYEYVQKAELHTVTSINSKLTAKGETFEYHSGHYYFEGTDNMFATEVEAFEASKKLCAKAEEEQRTRADHIKKDKNQNYSWNAGYHTKEANRLEQSIKYHREKAILCMAKARKNNDK